MSLVQTLVQSSRERLSNLPKFKLHDGGLEMEGGKWIYSEFKMEKNQLDESYFSHEFTKNLLFAECDLLKNFTSHETYTLDFEADAKQSTHLLSGQCWGTVMLPISNIIVGFYFEEIESKFHFSFAVKIRGSMDVFIEMNSK